MWHEERLRRMPWTGAKICRGALLDGARSYAMDVLELGFRDVREEVHQERARQGDSPPPSHERLRAAFAE